MLIAEDLLLLLLDDESGRATSSYLDVALGGALLVELAIAGDVVVEGREGIFARKTVRVTATERAADPVLDDALALVAQRERTAQDLVGRLGKGAREVLLPRLAERGLVRLEEGRVLGLFPTKRWPAADSAHEEAVRRMLGDVLVRGVTPDERTAALCALLHATDQAHKVVDRDGLSRTEVKRRAKQVSEGDWAAKAVRDAIQASVAAVVAVTAATTAATSAG